MCTPIQIKSGLLKNLLKQWIEMAMDLYVHASAIFRQIWCQNNCWNNHRNRNLETNEWRKIWWKAKLIRKRSMVSVLLSGQNFLWQQIFISQHCLRFSTQLLNSLCESITENSFSPFSPRISSLQTLGTILSKKLNRWKIATKGD